MAAACAPPLCSVPACTDAETAARAAVAALLVAAPAVWAGHHDGVGRGEASCYVWAPHHVAPHHVAFAGTATECEDSAGTCDPVHDNPTGEVPFTTRVACEASGGEEGCSLTPGSRLVF